MSVKVTKDDTEILELSIDNGDKQKLEQVLNKWNFKDYESLLRFAASVLLSAEDNTISIKIKSATQEVIPADNLLKK
jgi:hypothetical protein